jgi:hypothetical protein
MTSETAAPASPTAPARRPSVDESSLGAWRAFIQTHARLLHRLDEELQAAHGLWPSTTRSSSSRPHRTGDCA